MLTILLVLLICLALGGGWWGYYGGGPVYAGPGALGLVVLVIILWLVFSGGYSLPRWR